MYINVGGKREVITRLDNKNIKRNCFICGKKIESDEKYLQRAETRYIEKGNCCSNCNATAEKHLKENKNI